jgi:hypothetical protein
LRKLFGILPLAIIALVLIPACGDDGSSPVDNGNDQFTTRELRDVDYVHNTFFYFDHPAEYVGPQAGTIKVYRSRSPQDPPGPSDPGWAVPDPLGCGDAMLTLVAQLNTGQTPANALQQDFALLAYDEYSLIYSGAGEIIGLQLRDPILPTDLRTLAVSYVSVDGWPVGGTYLHYGVVPSVPGYSPDNLILEMLKAPDPDPQGAFGVTWSLEMRGVYDLGAKNIEGSSLEITVLDVLSPRAEPWFPEGSTVPYLQIFGLDQTDAAGSGPSDGRIDLARVDLHNGWLFFPAEQAFHPDASLVNAWTGGQFSFTAAYQPQYDVSQAIYTEKLTPLRTEEVHQYLIRVRSQ